MSHETSSSPSPEPSTDPLIVHLVGSPRKWEVPVGSTIRIGRGPDNDISLAHQRVSRSHAVLHYEDGHWTCSCFGRNGTIVRGGNVENFEVEDGLMVQFGGGTAPVLHFQLAGLDRDDPETAAVTNWLRRLNTGDRDALGDIWGRYFPRVVNLARVRLQARYRRMADEEDVALSVFQSLVDGVEQGKFPDLQNRDNLWRLLAVITSRKAVDRVQHERRQKRGGGDVRGDSIFLDETAEAGGFARFADDDPTPDLALDLAERADAMLDALPTDEHRRIAELRLEGHDNAEIAELLDINVRKVQRRLEDIRSEWQAESAE